MKLTSLPDFIDSRRVLQVYGAMVTTLGLLIYMWPLRMVPAAWAQELQADNSLVGIPFAGLALVRIGATVLVALGMCAVAFAGIQEPAARRRALAQFGLVHLVAGLMFALQWQAVLSQALPAAPGWLPLGVGTLLIYLAIESQFGPPRQRYEQAITLFSNNPAAAPTERLRTQYEEQIARAARREERERLARDLHDAVKQQLFVINTAAATAQQRYQTDTDGTRAAIDQVRTSAREATVEMEAMLAQLQTPPLSNAGLLDALQKQCDALRFRTGATVTFTADPLPPEWAQPPGAAEALLRVAQEALSNIARHARAWKVDVRLGVAGGRCTLTIHDNGTGFDPDVMAMGIGRRSMRTRAEEVGGDFELWSRPGKGTTITVTVPYETTTPAELRNRVIAWTAMAILASATFVLRWNSTDVGVLHFVIALGSVVTATQAVFAFLRLRKRMTAAA